MTSWANARRYADLERDNARKELEDDRLRALTLPCEEPGCGAQPDEMCRNLRDGGPLTMQVVHHRRLVAGRDLAASERDGGDDGRG